MDRSAAFHLAIISEARIDQGRRSRHRTKEFNLLELKNARARFRSGATDREIRNVASPRYVITSIDGGHHCFR